MTDDEIKAKLSERTVLLLTIWGESRGVSVWARVAVGCVARNRLAAPSRYRATASTYHAICLAPSQFSCWNGGDTNYAMIMLHAERFVTGEPMLDPLIAECGWIADGLITNVVTDTTQGATFYVEKTLLSKAPPAWIANVRQLCAIDPFVLFRERSGAVRHEA
jgi:cell wall hydrolase